MSYKIIFIIAIIAVFVADGFAMNDRQSGGASSRNSWSTSHPQGSSGNHIGKSIRTWPTRNNIPPITRPKKSESIRCNQPGYKPTMDNQRCEPYCEGCEQGKCDAPGMCQCNKGYFRNRDTNKCYPRCQMKCKNARCMAPDYCQCNPGFVPINRTTCRPARCSCNDHGLCLADNHCSKCKLGYFKSIVQNVIRCMPDCKNFCPNGKCVSPGNCWCNLGYRLNKETGVCYPVCNKVTCDNGFTCVAPNHCNCRGTINNITVINGTSTTVQQKCISRGSVLSDMDSSILLILVAIMFNSYYSIN